MIKNKDFFNRPKPAAAPAEGTKPTQDTEAPIQPQTNRVELRRQIVDNTRALARVLVDADLKPLANEVARIYRGVNASHFTVAVVGEFSRGKSTLINRLLGEKVLPEGNLPTTALLTRVTYGAVKSIIVHDEKGKSVRQLPLTEASWEGLVADLVNERQPEGSITVTYPDKWLGQHGIDILDTPGAGDLEEKRALEIGRALVGSHAALIAVDATKALSLSEQLFVEQRLLANKLPFMALVITKLDFVNLDERDQVVDYIIKKAHSLWGNIPMFISSADVEMPSPRFQPMMGLDKIRNAILAWSANEERARLTECWLATQLLGVIATAEGALSERLALLSAKDDERKSIIASKVKALNGLSKKWDELRSLLNDRAEKCINALHNRLADYGTKLVERLQFEAEHAQAPQRWIDDGTYAYRVKVELANLSASLDQYAKSLIAADLHWLNGILTNQFKAGKVDIEAADRTAESLFAIEEASTPGVKKPELDDLQKVRTKATIVTAVGAVAAALALATSGGLAILGTIGVSTGGAVISSALIGRKADEQRQIIKSMIAKRMPATIEEASDGLDIRVKEIYNEIFSKVVHNEAVWFNTQKQLIEKANPSQVAAEQQAAQATIDSLRQLSARLTAFTNVAE